MLQDDAEQLRSGVMLTAWLAPSPINVMVCTTGTQTAALGGDTCVKLVVPLTGGPEATTRTLKELLTRMLGLAHDGLMLHGQTSGEAEGPAGKATPKTAGAAAEAEAEEEEPTSAEAEEEPGAASSRGAEEPPAPAEQAKAAEEDEGFEEVLRARAAAVEAKEAAALARTRLQAGVAAVKRANAAAAKAVKAMENEQAEQAKREAERAASSVEAVEASAAEVGAAAALAEAKAREVGEALDAAKQVVEEKKAMAIEAKEAARVVSKELQQARIQRKKVAQALEASKLADEERDAKAAAAAKAKRSEEGARAQRDNALASAGAAKEIAAHAAELVVQVRDAVAKAAEVAAFAEAADIARARAWLEESAEAEVQGYALPEPALALRDDDELEPLGVRHVLCRLRPRLARLLSELQRCDELWLAMGAHSESVVPRAWSFGLARTREFLSSCFSTSNGDLAFQADAPFSWRVAMRGPRGSFYEGGTFWLGLEFGATWPRQPPELRFRPPFYHCNVSEDGTISPEAEPLREVRTSWQRESTVFQLLGAVAALLCVADERAPARPELLALLLGDPEAYADAARDFARQHASAHIAGAVPARAMSVP